MHDANDICTFVYSIIKEQTLKKKIMDWNNVDLTDGYERDQNILDPYSFDILLLEISCNVREIDEKTVKAQFLESLNSKIESAKEVFEANLKNIVKQAKKERQG